MKIWQPLIICNNPPEFPNACDFQSLILLVNNLITDLIIISTLLATVGFVYAGFRLLTSGGNEEAMKSAKNTAWNIGKGFFFILIAWVLVYTITNVLLAPGYSLLGAPTK